MAGAVSTMYRLGRALHTFSVERKRHIGSYWFPASEQGTVGSVGRTLFALLRRPQHTARVPANLFGIGRWLQQVSTPYGLVSLWLIYVVIQI